VRDFCRKRFPKPRYFVDIKNTNHQNVDIKNADHQNVEIQSADHQNVNTQKCPNQNVEIQNANHQNVDIQHAVVICMYKLQETKKHTLRKPNAANALQVLS
jgi:uncharacterized protein YjbI with pentapeptide repeats